SHVRRACRNVETRGAVARDEREISPVDCSIDGDLAILQSNDGAGIRAATARRDPRRVHVLDAELSPEVVWLVVLQLDRICRARIDVQLFFSLGCVAREYH